MHQPMMSADDLQRVAEWHERAYRTMRARHGLTQVTCLGRTFAVPPDVFPPVGEMVGRVVLDEVRPSDRVLDMGTGSGVNAVLAASVSDEVTGLDINPRAVECAAHNAAANDVASRCTFLESDVFDAVDGTFDLMIFDPPFRWFRARDELELSIADENYGALTRFMAQAPEYLAAGGRILLHFGSSGDLRYLRTLIAQHSYRAEAVAHDQLVQDGWTVDYYVFRLTIQTLRGNDAPEANGPLRYAPLTPAELTDASRLLALREAAARWMEETGIHQWRPGEVSLQELTEQVRRGEWLVVRDGEAVVGAVRLQWADAIIWDGRDCDHVAYVHGLVIDRRFAGTGLGRHLLAGAEAQARAGGARLLRLDCVESNSGLRSYYQEQGFRTVGRRDLGDRWAAVVLLEKPLGHELPEEASTRMARGVRRRSAEE